MDEALKKKVDTLIGLCRLGGGTLAIIGGLMLFFFLQAAFDPHAVITINGIPTTDKYAKTFAVVFCALFPLIGLFMAFVQEKHLVKWVTALIKRLN
ncbi:MAG: hypothetical protein KJ556_06960 [Gammaproteobacteria bacterium]|nr:hypothetical protein [Gammaproteobacteria bacterium]MBU2057247.1 hypothetical protein [Gammaproteobacteria bacterium]MBU2174849.1 hypothetical protein [Gammaproteobacteria bacterium]MBU2245454.1 hypothetical protein [Gammaproteobacteria bacterium]MBU2344234.1 hypothetical protein [Gammaproteobacteria bacterium]